MFPNIYKNLSLGTLFWN